MSAAPAAASSANVPAPGSRIAAATRSTKIDADGDAGHETDDRAEQEVAPADVRRAGDDVDDRERPDRHDARENDREQAALAEPSRQVVEPPSGEPAHRLPAQATADGERRRTAQRRAEQRVDGAQQRTEDDGA